MLIASYYLLIASYYPPLLISSLLILPIVLGNDPLPELDTSWCCWLATTPLGLLLLIVGWLGYLLETIPYQAMTQWSGQRLWTAYLYID